MVGRETPKRDRIRTSVSRTGLGRSGNLKFLSSPPTFDGNGGVWQKRHLSSGLSGPDPLDVVTLLVSETAVRSPATVLCTWLSPNSRRGNPKKMGIQTMERKELNFYPSPSSESTEVDDPSKKRGRTRWQRGLGSERENNMGGKDYFSSFVSNVLTTYPDRTQYDPLSGYKGNYLFSWWCDGLPRETTLVMFCPSSLPFPSTHESRTTPPFRSREGRQ